MLPAALSFAAPCLRASRPLLVPTAQAHRKPRWLPVAKSRIYRIPKRPVVPEEEKVELKRINNNYHTQMRALRRFYHEEMLAEKSSQLDATSEHSLRQEALDFDRCMKINDEWNASIAKQREVRLAELETKMQERALTIMVQKDRSRREEIEKANELIQTEKEASKTFITEETLDAAIEHALANPVDYNYAIDHKGNRYYGRDANTSLEKKEEAAQN